MVLWPGEQMESGLGFFCQSLRTIIPRSDFKVQAMQVSALVLVLDAKVGNRNLVVHNFEVVLACEVDSLVGQFPIWIDPRELPVQLMFKLVVEDNPTHLASHAVNFLGHLVVEAIEVGIMAGLLSFDEAVINRLSIWNHILSLKKGVSLFR